MTTRTDGEKHRHHRSRFTHKHNAPGPDTKPVTHGVDEARLRALGFNNTTIRLLQNVDGKLERLVEETKKVLVNAGEKIDFQVTQGFRTAREQYACYLRGKSPCDGYRKKSDHQSAAAVDFSVFQNGVYDENGFDPLYRKVADAFKTAAARLGAPVVWGGDFQKKKDPDHIQLAANQPASAFAGGSNRAGPTREAAARMSTAKPQSPIDQAIKNLTDMGILKPSPFNIFGPK